MATPEIKLPRDGASSANTNPSLEKTEPSSFTDRRLTGNDSGEEDVIPTAAFSTSLGEQSIKYHYLTFETDLPAPSTIVTSLPDGRAAPEPPNLSNYVSPFTWSESRKSFITWLSCAVTVVTAYTAGAYSPAIAQMSAEWDVSEEAALVGITTFTTGFAIAPMVLAPFSEFNGRKPVFVASGILFVICQLCCAVTRSFPGMLVARFFVGVGGSTFSTMVGGVVSDIYHTKDRNTPMALFSGAALCGTGLGPLVSGFIAQHTSWRWVFYVQVIDCGLMILAVILFFKETRGSVLLSRKAHLLNTWYEKREHAGFSGFMMPCNDGSGKTESQRIRWKVKSDEERESLAKMIKVSLYRPFCGFPRAMISGRTASNYHPDLLLTEPVCFWFSMWVAFSWAVLYLTFGAIPLVFTTNHGFNLEQNGAVFAGKSWLHSSQPVFVFVIGLTRGPAISVGAIISTILSIWQEKVAMRFGKLSSTPEGRLYFSCIESALMPIGLFW